MPIRHLTVTGSLTAPVMAATQSPTSAGSAIRQAEAAYLPTIRGTTDIEVDLVIAELFGDTRALGKLPQIAAAELERNRMLGRIVRQEPRAIRPSIRLRSSSAAAICGN